MVTAMDRIHRSLMGTQRRSCCWQDPPATLDDSSHMHCWSTMTAMTCVCCVGTTCWTTKKDIVASFEALGAKVITCADMENIDQLAVSMTGSEIVISTIGGSGHVVRQLSLIQACKIAGVRKFVPSEYGIDFDAIQGPLMPIFEGKKVVHDALKESGLDYTFYVAGFFMDTIFSEFFGLNFGSGKATIPGDGNTLCIFTLREDIAEFVAETVDDPRSSRATLRLSGDELTLHEAARVFGKWGETSKISYISLDELLADIELDSNPYANVPSQLLYTLGSGNALIGKPNNNEDFKFRPRPLLSWLSHLAQS
eukprot:Opistho-2@83492